MSILKKLLGSKESAAEKPEVKGVNCLRCNRPSLQKMEGDKYWCSWCNDWAPSVGTPDEGISGQRDVPVRGPTAGSPMASLQCVRICRGCKKSFQTDEGWRVYCPTCDAYYGGRVKDAFGGKYSGLK